MFLPEIDANLFEWELWEANCWDALDLSFAESMELDKLFAKIKQYGIGYCDSSKLIYRPRPGYYAIMCERDGQRFWFHVCQLDFEED
jgi:hypothetical protein